MSPRVIGIYANGIGAGKSTVAGMLAEEGFKIVSFAAPMKDMLAVLLQALGHNETDVRLMLTDQHKKQQNVPGIEKTPRHLMRTLGTEWGRELIHPDLWLMCWEVAVRHYLRQGVSVVCDDIRMANELGLVESMPNSQIWRIEWEGAEVSDHASDNGIPGWHEPDVVIENNEGLEELYAKVQRALG